MEFLLAAGCRPDRLDGMTCLHSQKMFVVCRGMAHAVRRIPLKNKTIQCETPACPEVAKILVEALAVLVAGVVFALAANQISPRGLALARNYFPQGTTSHEAMTTGTGSTGGMINTNSTAISPAQLLAARLRDQGLQLMEGSRTAQLFHDPRFQQGSIVFIDAREEAPYQEGHIPGAYEFDPYHPDKYFSTVFPVCRAAEQIVVYCNGGDCDDSESAAVTLRDVGIATNKLFIYGGGIAEWATNGLPVEVGARNSGNRRNPKQ
jgi:rhodanese-related sulfurtransferase